MIYTEELAHKIQAPPATKKSWKHRGEIPNYYINHPGRIKHSETDILELRAFVNRSLIKVKQFAEMAGVHPQKVYDFQREKSLPVRNQLSSLIKAMKKVKRESRKLNTTEKQIRFLKLSYIAHSFAVKECGSNLQSHLEGGFSLKDETEEKLNQYFNNLHL